MPYSGYSIFAYKNQYTNRYKNLYNSEIKKTPYNKNIDVSIKFIKDIYRVKQNTGNINYFDCDCIKFID